MQSTSHTYTTHNTQIASRNYIIITVIIITQLPATNCNIASIIVWLLFRLRHNTNDIHDTSTGFLYEKYLCQYDTIQKTEKKDITHRETPLWQTFNIILLLLVSRLRLYVVKRVILVMTFWARHCGTHTQGNQCQPNVVGIMP